MYHHPLSSTSSPQFQMEESEQQLPPPRQQHRRAKIACKNCNARRVRCNAYLAQPCWNCQRIGASCELIVSRRGKYVLRIFTGLIKRIATDDCTADMTDLKPKAETMRTTHQCKDGRQSQSFHLSALLLEPMVVQTTNT